MSNFNRLEINHVEIKEILRTKKGVLGKFKVRDLIPDKEEDWIIVTIEFKRSSSEIPGVLQEIKIFRDEILEFLKHREKGNLNIVGISELYHDSGQDTLYLTAKLEEYEPSIRCLERMRKEEKWLSLG